MKKEKYPEIYPKLNDIPVFHNIRRTLDIWGGEADMIEEGARARANVLQVPLAIRRPHFSVISANDFRSENNGSRVFCDKPVGMPPYH